MFRGKGYLFIICLVVALIVTVVAKKSPVVARGIENVVVDVTKPVLWLFSRPVVAFEKTEEFFHNFAVAWDNNQSLRKKNADLQNDVRELVLMKAENKQLRRLLHYTSKVPFKRVAAGRVFADINTPFLHTVLVDAGSDAGISPGLVAFDNAFVVGRVLSVGRFYSRVLLLSDSMSHVPVADIDRTVNAILVGQGGNKAELTYYPKKTHFTVGERIITSGMGGIFPAGLAVGVVSSVQDGHVQVDLEGQLNALSYIQFFSYVLPNPLQVLDGTALPDKSHHKRRR